MSRLLKLIVNLFLLCAILTGAAILVPPLLGVSTTVIDSPGIETNLPVGSVTYSENIAAGKIVPGDTILQEQNDFAYKYLIKEKLNQDSYRVQDAVNPDEAEEEIVLRNMVARVILTVPLIGYLVIAMQSFEGMIIVGLIVLSMIILFILSELWKKSDDEEDEDDEDDENEEDDEIVSEMPVEKASEAETISEAPVAEELKEEAIFEAPVEEEIEEAIFEASVEEEVISEASAEEPAIPEVIVEEEAEAEVISEAPVEEESEAETISEAPVEEEFEAETISKTPVEEEPEAEVISEAPVGETSAEKPDIPDIVIADPEGFSMDAPKVRDHSEALSEGGEEVIEEEHGTGEFFIPIERATLEEILEQAKKDGDSVEVRRDEITGIQIVDYSKVI